MNKDFNLEKLKLDYKELQQKYGLPTFENLNHDFYIEKIADSETEILTREIRRFIADKVYNYIRFCETLLNPANAPMFIFSMIKSLAQEDREKLSNIYGKLSEINMELVRLDLEFSEKEDADFIKKTHESWKGIKSELVLIIRKLKNSKDKKEDKSSSGYFG